MGSKRKNLGEKWVLYVGRKSLRRCWSLLWLLFAIIAAVHLTSILLYTSRVCQAALDAGISVGFGCLALLFFERRNFYLIIQKQKEHIANLESKVNEAKQDTDKSVEL